MKKKRPAVHYVPATIARKKHEDWKWASLAETVECANNIRQDHPELLNPGEKLDMGETSFLLLFGSLMKDTRDFPQHVKVAASLYTFIEDGIFHENEPVLPNSPSTTFVPYGWASIVLELIEQGVHHIEVEEINPPPKNFAPGIQYWACFRRGKKQKMKGSGKNWTLTLEF